MTVNGLAIFDSLYIDQSVAHVAGYQLQATATGSPGLVVKTNPITVARARCYDSDLFVLSQQPSARFP